MFRHIVLNTMLRLVKSNIKQKQIFRNFSSDSRRPDFTKNRYQVKKIPFNPPTEKDVSMFEAILGKNNVIHGSSETESYNIDWLHAVRGDSKIVLRPKTTEEVSNILKYCNEKLIAVTPQGGNTGLVGGSVPVFDEIIISTNRMNKIIKIDPVTNILVCQSGCILDFLDGKLAEEGLCMPLDLGSKGSCHIGGNISTNAGGLRLLRYGNLHGSVLGLEVVSANGQVIDLLSNFKKDNTGYHLKHLYIGSEGTLGFITKAAIFCPQKSESTNVAFLALNKFEDVLKTFQNAKIALGEILSACEFIDKESLIACIEAYNLHSPIGDFPFYMLIETRGSNSSHDEDKLNNFLENQLQNGNVLDGTTTNEPSKINELWSLREKIPSSLTSNGTYCFKYDLSLPLNSFYKIVSVLRERVKHIALRTTGYGHIGDSNLHLNVQCSEYNEELKKLIEPFVYNYTSELRGSISAEHGIGFLKKSYLPLSKQPQALTLMKSLKSMMDPNGILNPYKIFQK